MGVRTRFALAERSVVNERLPAGIDPDAWTTADYALAVTGQLGLMTFAAGAYELVTNGLMTGLTYAALLGCAAIAAAAAALHGAQFALHAGSRIRAAGCGLATVVAIALAAAGLMEGSGTVFAHVPTPAICAVGALLPAWTLFYNPPPAPARERPPSEAWLKAEAPRRHWWRRNDVRSAAGTAFFGIYLVNNLHDHGPVWLTVMAAFGAYTSAASLIGQLRRNAKHDRRSAA